MLISLVRHDTLGDFANSIEAAAMGFTNSVNRENARELLICEGYKVVPVTADCSICAYAVHEKKPQQIIHGIRIHFLFADTGATLVAPVCLLS